MGLDQLPDQFDVIVVGGGITGAGVLREAVRMGLKTLLLEKNDFAWGTSSRSSKLVHGGLRYIKEGRLHLTYASVSQRQRLLAEAPGLVEELGFLLPIYKSVGPGKRIMSIGLTLYDIMARQWDHRFYDTDTFLGLAPRLNAENLEGGFRFTDAQVDDARLVQRLINEAIDRGGAAANYACVTELQQNAQGKVTGVCVRDSENGATKSFSAKTVINATGSWAEDLHPSPKQHLHLRALRGSHLMLPAWRLPIQQAVTLIHPDDERPLFIIPWEGALMLGTTDIDHGRDIHSEIVMDKTEASYMLDCLKAYFPDADIGLGDCISAYAGIRPVLSKGGQDPSSESREHEVWRKNGLVTVTGGKLTTFRMLAADALKAAAPDLPGRQRPKIDEPAFFPVPSPPVDRRGLSAGMWRRLYGRYGRKAETIVGGADQRDLKMIPGTHHLWAELPVLAETEQVRHLSDLLMRRVRVGLLCTNGGRAYLDRIQDLCAPVLDWDAKRWQTERKNYIEYWQYAHGLPG
ncbi:MAG: FAD-dependent oxidoreductase [Thermodesulfobacteriota bacterium]